MTAKAVRLRARARADVRAAVAYYRREAGEGPALAFVEAFRATLTAVGRSPAAGSPRYAELLNRSGLRSRGLRGFPYLVFYVERHDDVDVLRVLHGRRDIPSLMER